MKIPGKSGKAGSASAAVKKMEYNFYHYSQLGDYYCPRCGFKRPKLDFDGTNVSLADGIAFDVGDFHVKANYRGFYNVYNILAVFGAASLAGVSPGKL